MSEMQHKIRYIFDENNIILCRNLSSESFNLVLSLIEVSYVTPASTSRCEKKNIYYKNVNPYEVINNSSWLSGEK